ncbi:SCO family protein [Actibacterium pelagium]|uniref:Protein senC n=1 Tax=Actibacterium pelagium TaxID=2029103 RepID=A0A917AJQ6_9RHOB|nr:SCO family protein [Actibacterium pelagium]GGE55680.1 protein senC [Actibacterium pelagium]
MTKTYAFLAGSAAVIALAVATGFVLLGEEDECRSGAVAGGGGSIGGPFTLVDETGTTVTDTDVITRPSLVYFGYTFCPDVCPMDAGRNGEAISLLQEKGYDVQGLFISIDPERDTPEALAEFTDYLHPDMIGLTGTPEQVKAASQAYKTYYKKQDGDEEYYLMDHSTFTYLVTPEDGFLDFFRREVPAQELAEKVGCFLDM